MEKGNKIKPKEIYNYGFKSRPTVMDFIFKATNFYLWISRVLMHFFICLRLFINIHYNILQELIDKEL